MVHYGAPDASVNEQSKLKEFVMVKFLMEVGSQERFGLTGETESPPRGGLSRGENSSMPMRGGHKNSFSSGRV